MKLPKFPHLTFLIRIKQPAQIIALHIGLSRTENCEIDNVVSQSKIEDQHLETVSLVSQKILEYEPDNISNSLNSQIPNIDLNEFAKMLHLNNHDFVIQCKEKNFNRTNSHYDFNHDDICTAFKISSVDSEEFEILDIPVNLELENISTESSEISLSSSKENICIIDSPIIHKSRIPYLENANWNKFLKDISQLTIEIDDTTEEFL